MLTTTIERLASLKVFTVYDGMSGIFYNVVTDNEEDARRCVYHHVGPELREERCRSLAKRWKEIERMDNELNIRREDGCYPAEITNQDYWDSLEVTDDPQPLKDRMVVECPWQ